MILKILLTVFAMSFFILPAFSQSLLEITLSEEVYFEGDIIVISGKVSTVIQETPVTIQVIHLGENESIIEIAQIEVAQDGTFTHEVRTEGPLWRVGGEYVVRASYGSDNKADVYFEFFKKEQGVSLIFEVENPDQSGTFDIEYIIRGGNVTDIIVDQEFFELIVLIDAKSDGAITLELPRTVIDAKQSDVKDDIFIILIDGVEVPYTQIQNDTNTRTITIQFEEIDSDIEIIGTFVIPEFGTIASLVLAVSIISIIIISSKRNLVRI